MEPAFACYEESGPPWRRLRESRSLHYNFLAPIRREVLAAGKFLSALVASSTLFAGSVVAAYVCTFLHFGPQFEEFFFQGGGLSHLGWYVAVTVLACIGYGAVFLLMGVLFRNPMIPAAIVMVWENINTFMPLSGTSTGQRDFR